MSHQLFQRAIVASLTNTTCPLANAEATDESSFWDKGGIHWDSHRIGWAVAGGCTLVVCLVSGTNVFLHCRNYRKPLEQRQIIRILLMPIVFSVISFLGYRFFREFVYFELVRNTYEAFTIAAFVVLMLMYVSSSPAEQREVMSTKEKRKLVFPFCCWRYRPSKPYFIFAVKWSVMQFVILKPLISIASIVTEVLGVYCATSSSFAFANIYLEIVDFVSVSIALYGLIVFYALVRQELAGHRALSKFWTIKIIVALVFYQGFVFTILQKYDVIKASAYWTATNVSEGLNALVTTMEMVLIALFQLYAFSYRDYSDFAIDIYYSLKFFIDSARKKPYTRSTTAYQAQVTASGGNSYGMSEALAPTSSPPSYDDYPGAIDPQRPYMTPEVWGGSYGDGGGSMAGVGAGMKKEEGGHSYPPVYGDRMESSTQVYIDDDALSEAIEDLWESNPPFKSLGLTKLLAEIKRRHPTWACSERRLRKLRADLLDQERMLDSDIPGKGPSANEMLQALGFAGAGPNIGFNNFGNGVFTFTPGGKKTSLGVTPEGVELELVPGVSTGFATGRTFSKSEDGEWVLDVPARDV
ncbi:hypothetical protein RQP46_010561 [Phenoliferia psychrophenolica]